MPSEPTIVVKVDLANPGQFFACCGLLEAAHRLDPSAEGWFAGDRFCLQAAPGGQSLAGLLPTLGGAPLGSDDPSADDKATPLRLGEPFDLRLDWWLDDLGGAALKTWAGQQSVLRIARAMQAALPVGERGSLLDIARVVPDPANPKQSVEPFYFDARRFANSLDVGFSLDEQEVQVPAHPAVEFLALVGLQRFQPAPAPARWRFSYWPWPRPLPAPVAAAVACGAVDLPGCHGFQYDLRFRDARKRYKAFGHATLMGGDL